MLLTCYGCGLRVSELVKLKIHHIDSERRLLRIEQAKGAKDRLVVLPPKLLQQLRLYWRQYHPGYWLFPNSHTPSLSLSISTIQKHYRQAKNKAGILKVGGIHGLRHAYATHQLERGLPVHQLQHQLGHQQLQTTLRYVHWVASYQQGSGAFSDLVEQLEADHE
ncbi:MAG: integrase/recombinase XerD [Planctomycetota bacterium]|jgi:integrase/recombinase XerD